MRNRVNQMHGPHRRPVRISGAAVSSQAAERWARPTVARHACSVERCVVGVTHGCSLARSASSLSALSNLSSTLPTVAALGTLPASATNTGRRPTRPREAGSERSFHRRQLQFGQKRGSGVGPTKRGKGSKIMAIADRHGLPVAVHVVSASPNEATLSNPRSSADSSAKHRSG
jgi:hypothetical protein